MSARLMLRCLPALTLGLGALPAQAAPPGQTAAPEPADESTDESRAAAPDLAPDDLGVPDATPTALGPTAPAPLPAPASRFGLVWSGAVDFGFFVPFGNHGAGWIQDEGPDRAFPAETYRWGWVFLGDIFAPAVNTRGEPADLGNAPGVVRDDSLHSHGAASFVVNEVNFTATASAGDNLLGTASFNVVPRSGANFSHGDGIELDLAQLEWLPTASGKTSVFAGKMESVVGIEYRERKAAQRFGITPSLISRYTTGTPLGLKVRHKIGDAQQLILALAVTNGSSVVEPFHFYDEIDSNDGKTVSGRLAGRLRGALHELEVGVSGSYGAQDRAFDSHNSLWFFGVDALAHLGPLDLKAQWLIGRGRGETSRLYEEAHRPYGLHLAGGAYLEADLMLTPWLGLLGRAELRDARVWLGNADAPGGGDRLYITKSWRATGGVRVVFNARTILKAEYLKNGEYGGVPSIPNDVVTSSLVWIF